jgi:hypothetical protein
MKRHNINKRERIQMTIAIRPDDKAAFKTLLHEDDLFASQLFNRMINLYKQNKSQESGK